MKIKLSDLRRVIREEAEDMLSVERPEDVKPIEDNWGTGDKQNVKIVNHMKANSISEHMRKINIDELKDIILSSLYKHKQ